MFFALISAFFAGFASFFSPCIFPVLPGYLSLLSAFSASHAHTEQNSRYTAVQTGINAVFFCIGFSSIFIALGASATAFGKFLNSYSANISVLAGIVLVFMGFFMLDLIKIPAFQYERKYEFSKIKVHGHLGAFLMGLAFSLGWTPCIGPVLTGFLALAGTEETFWKGAVLLSSYSFGLSVPFVAAGFGAGKIMTYFKKHKKVVIYSKIISASLLILIGIILIFRSKLLFLSKIIPV